MGCAIPRKAKIAIFAERGHQTLDDLRDLIFMAENYLTPTYAALVAGQDIQWCCGGVLLLGRDMAAGCRPVPLAKLLPILAGLAHVEHPRFSELAGGGLDDTEELRRRNHFATLFSWMLHGANLNASPSI